MELLVNYFLSLSESVAIINVKLIHANSIEVLIQVFVDLEMRL